MKQLTNKKLILLLLTITILVIISLYLYIITKPHSNQHLSLTDGRYFIAHATGSLKGYTYLNSKESLMNSLDNGYKYIEIDLQYTSDSNIVCVHDWEQFNKATIPNITGQDSNLFIKIPSIEEFKKRRIYGEYTPLTLTDVIEIQEKRSFTIVTDLICDAQSLNRYFIKEKRKNVMVEAFSENDYYRLKDAGYIPMLSIGCVNPISCLKFVTSHILNRDINWITVEEHSSKRSLRLLKKIFHLKIALYTVNSPRFFRWHLGSDVDLIYTDNWDLKRQLNTYQDNSTH